MKKIFSIVLLTFTLSNSFGQRYLKPVFPSVDVTNNIVYGSALNYQGINQTLKLDFYEPSGDIENKRPLIIYAHGGGFQDMNQTKSLVHIVAFCDSFARRGYAVASIDYRLDNSISHRAIMNAMYDARAAIRFFKANAELYKIDTTNIFMGGESAGAITSLNVNYINTTNELLYPLIAPYSTLGTVEGSSGNPGYNSKTKATLCFCGGTKTAALDPVFDTTSIQSPNDPPLLMVHGTSDPLIPVSYALEVAVRANHRSLPYLFYPMYGATHCPWFYPLANSWKYLDTLVNYTSTFLYATLSLTTGRNSESVGEFNVYPNPAKDKLNIIFPNNINKNIKIYLFDRVRSVFSS